MTPEKEEIQDPSSVNVENIELTVMDDISSPLVPSNSGKDNSSSDEEGGDSSGSEEDRYCTCTVCQKYMCIVHYMYNVLYMLCTKYGFGPS